MQIILKIFRLVRELAKNMANLAESLKKDLDFKWINANRLKLTSKNKSREF